MAQLLTARRSEASTAAARLLAAAAVLLSAAACASAPPGWPAAPGLSAPPGLAAVIDSVAGSPDLAATTLGVAVFDPTAGQWIARFNAGKHFIPASNTKLVVTTVALGELGPDYRWETPVFVSAEPGDSVATGLVVVGRGDPTFSRRFHDTDFTVTDSIADRIAAAGIRHISGDITIDVSFFGDRSANGAWEVGDLPWSYAPPIEAFAIAEGTFSVVMVGSSMTGQDATISTIGPPGLQSLEATATTDTAGSRASVDADYLDRADRVTISGSVGVGGTDTTRLAVTSPALYAGRALEWALKGRGVTVDGDIRVLRDSAEAATLRDELLARYRRIATLQSPPLSEVVAAILRPSQNWIAEQLLKTLGAERRGSGGWSTGLDVERRYLIDVAGIDSTAFFLRDASGLAPQNLISPTAAIGLLEHARTADWGTIFVQALAEPGMEDSTLENRLTGLKGRLRAKTGTITNVNSLSGFITTADGRVLTFSIMTNASGVSSAAVRRGIDRIVEAIAAEGQVK